MHCIPLAFYQCFMHLDVCLIIVDVCWLVWIGFYPWCNLFLARHMFMHSYIFFSFFLFWLWCVLPLSLSLSWIDCTWHLSANLLRLETLFVLGLLLTFLHPIFTFGFVMGRPSKTSLRTFRNVAFIRSVMLSCWTFPTLLYPVSFGLRDGILYVRNPWGVPSCLYRSFTPIYTISIPLYLSLPWHFKIHVS